MVLGLAPDGSSTLAFADAMGATRAGLGVDASGRGSFSMYDAASQRASPSAPDSDDSGANSDSAKVDSAAATATTAENSAAKTPRRR